MRRPTLVLAVDGSRYAYPIQKRDPPISPFQTLTSTHQIAEDSFDGSTWGVDRSHSFQAGIFRSAERGEVIVTLKFANRRDSGSGHRGWTAKYRPSGDGWKRVSTSEVSYASDKQAAKVGGWHVKGVRAFD